MQVKGKRVFLTGGGRGIGRAITEALLCHGAKVVFCDVNEDLGKATEAELQKQYGADNVSFTLCDVVDAQQHEAAFQLAVARLGAVDIFVNNAGIQIESANWEKSILVNQIGTIRGSQLAFQHMRRDQGGSGGVIINIVSLAGLYSCPSVPVYCSTKHAVLAFTVNSARKPGMAEMGVRWCSLCPGAVDTELYASSKVNLTEEEKEQFDKALCSPADIAVVFLKLVEDEDNNGCIAEVYSATRYSYRRRLVVDLDGVSNPIFSDEPFLSQLKK